ncbi:MAG: hypothetical protein E7261_03610 [Lachnospiraceae bacterium]|nr:hypothetical protein [Lachnospiraceae bacterium]
MAKHNNSNIRKYRKRHKTSNIGVIVFLIVFIYLSVTVFLYLSKENISIYQITEEGSLARNMEYTGMIIRNEHIVTADNAGYIRYYLRQGERVGKGDLIYSIDESGEVTRKLTESYSYEETLKKMDLSELKKQITSFVYNFDTFNFSEIYDFKTNMEYTVLDLMNYNNQEYLRNLLATVEADGMFNFCYAGSSGIVSYHVDGYEQLTEDIIKPDNLNKSGYSRTVLNSAEFIETNAPVYKIIDNNEWKLVFSLSDEDYMKYSSLQKLTIELSDYEYKFTVPFKVIQNETGKYGCLFFDKYSAEFANVRYLDFEILYEDNIGLKIPSSAVITKDFYIIPIEYRSLSQGVYGFYVETYDAQNNLVVEFVEPTIYNATETHYYVDVSALKEGSFILNVGAGGEVGNSVTTDNTKRYRISSKDSLSGVYNVNKGYTVFRKIEIIDSNTEYYIVKTGTQYGISLYDHIILDGKTVKDGQVIYR